MSKLFQVTAIQHDQVTFKPTTAVWLNPLQVVDTPSVNFIDNNGVAQVGTLIQYAAFRKNMPHFITATEPPSTVLERINDANTDDVHVINFTKVAADAQIPDSGYVAQIYKQAKSVNTADIWWLQAHPDDNARGFMIIQNQVRTTMENVKTFESADDLATAANDNA